MKRILFHVRNYGSSVVLFYLALYWYFSGNYMLTAWASVATLWRITRRERI